MPGSIRAPSGRKGDSELSLTGGGGGGGGVSPGPPPPPPLQAARPSPAVATTIDVTMLCGRGRPLKPGMR